MPLKDVVKHIQKVELLQNKEKIKEAIEMANKLDIIVLAGKGHEPYQEINGTKYPFDERIIVNEIIEKLENNKKQLQ